MAWIVSDSGEKVYKASAYAKEELPTWQELYDWYMLEDKVYNPEYDKDDLDPYWRIPKKEFMIITICNQLNKMLFEDGYRMKIINMINDYMGSDKIQFCDVKFDISKFFDFDNYENIPINVFNGYFTSLPLIYSIPLPTGKLNPFINPLYKRIAINKMNTVSCVSICIGYYFPSDGCPKPYSPNSSTTSYMNNSVESDKKCRSLIYGHEYRLRGIIMDTLLKDVLNYFSGEVGWKDENGKVIGSAEKEIVTPQCDPAL